MSDVPPPPPGSPPPPPPPPNLTPPPGYQAYGGAPTPNRPLSRVKGLSTAIVILTAITGVGIAINTAVTPGVTDSAKDFLEGRISEDDFLNDYGPVALTQILASLGLVAAGIVTMIWMYRISNNVRAIGRATTWAPLFAVFGWILPPVLVIIPFLMLRELWKASTAGDYGGDSWKQAPENPVLWAWFVLYGIVPAALFAVQVNALFAGGFSNDTESLAESIDDFGALNLLGGVANVLAAVAWIVFVRQLTQRHIEITRES